MIGTSSVTRPGATPPSDESGDEGSKDDATKYIPKDLAGDAPEHTTKGDLGHSENEPSSRNDTPVDEAAAPTDEGPALEDEGTIRDREKVFA
ncbi:hypothetical protein QYF36_021012 [Acer negundo]|nr:hypothetical protein QYF36_021012 [Acer negundo]